MWGRMRPVMRRFLRENPNVDVLFREKMPAMQMALLERRELDARDLANGDRTTDWFYQLTVA